MKYADSTYISQSSSCGGSVCHGSCFGAGAGTRGFEGDHRAADAGAATAGHGAAAAVDAGHALRRAAEPGAANRGPGQADERDGERPAAEDEHAERSGERQAGHRQRPGAVAERLGGRVEVAHRQAGQDDPGHAGAVAEHPDSAARPPATPKGHRLAGAHCLQAVSGWPRRRADAKHAGR